MKIIVAYASVGAGHFRAAETIYKYLKESCPAQDIKLLNILEKASGLFGLCYSLGYSFMVRQVPFLWALSYWITEFKYLRFISGPASRFLNRLNTRPFREFLIREKPDIVISTHFLTSEITSELIEAGNIKSRLVTVITDFTMHPFWVSKGTDIYVVASGYTKEELIREGIDADKIKELGIPVDARFLKDFDREGLCLKLGLDAHKFTVLLMTGSFGLGPLERITDSLQGEAQVLVVCASNNKLYEKLSKRKLADVKAFGFIDNTHELMAVSDMIITKPGGLTISEVLNMELVPVFISVIPGQEAGNVRALQKYGIGLTPESLADLKRIILDFRDDRGKLKAARDNIRKIKKPDCLKEICNVICEGGCRASR